MRIEFIASDRPKAIGAKLQRASNERQQSEERTTHKWRVAIVADAASVGSDAGSVHHETTRINVPVQTGFLPPTVITGRLSRGGRGRPTDRLGSTGRVAASFVGGWDRFVGRKWFGGRNDKNGCCSRWKVETGTINHGGRKPCRVSHCLLESY